MLGNSLSYTGLELYSGAFKCATNKIPKQGLEMTSIWDGDKVKQQIGIQRHPLSSDTHKVQWSHCHSNKKELNIASLVFIWTAGHSMEP